VAPPTLLFVARDITVQRVMSVLLRHFGYQVECVQDPVSARDEAARLMPAAVLVDAALGDAGWRLVRELRRDPVTGALPVVGVHAADRAEAVQAVSAGCDVCLEMPLDTHRLEAALRQYAPVP
jgi:CheY-like chemotaxis protein